MFALFINVNVLLLLYNYIYTVLITFNKMTIILHYPFCLMLCGVLCTNITLFIPGINIESIPAYAHRLNKSVLVPRKY